jgi:hypothetical protein
VPQIVWIVWYWLRPADKERGAGEREYAGNQNGANGVDMR